MVILQRTSVARQAPATDGSQAAVHRNRRIRMISGIGIPRSQSKIGMMFPFVYRRRFQVPSRRPPPSSVPRDRFAAACRRIRPSDRGLGSGAQSATRSKARKLLASSQSRSSRSGYLACEWPLGIQQDEYARTDVVPEEHCLHRGPGPYRFDCG